MALAPLARGFASNPAAIRPAGSAESVAARRTGQRPAAQPVPLT
jgi:hypothetical protein